MIILLVFAFLSGLATILAPCIWPLLPIILASSATGTGHRKPLGIVVGIILSFAIFTLTISFFIRIFGLDANVLRLVAVVIIGLLGFSLLIPRLGGIIEVAISRLSSKVGGLSQIQSHGFGGGLITGLALGVVWTPCAGPILATIAALSATGNVSSGLVLLTIVYLTGVGVPLFLFASFGQRLFSKTRFISQYTGRIQQVFGFIMLLTALAIYTNYDKILQVKLLDAFPGISTAIINIEENDIVKKELDKLDKNEGSLIKENPDSANVFNTHVQAPEFTGITRWLGSTPLTLKELRGKVVLVDFWTYTCINCIRSLPYVTSWYEKYKDKGFIVVGIHTPEFEFEKDQKNVENAIRQFKITYPVAQDNDYATWQAYDNHYWPAHYLINKDGIIRRIHFGEGDYEETEKAIQELLKEAGNTVPADMVEKPDETPRVRLSREAYLGSKRMEFLHPNGHVGNGTLSFTASQNIPNNSFSLGGTWTVTNEYSKSGKNAVLIHNFTGSKVFLVLRPSTENGGKVRVLLNGKVVDNTNKGADVIDNGYIPINEDKLYNLIDLKEVKENQILKIEFSEGVEVFAFTFG